MWKPSPEEGFFIEHQRIGGSPERNLCMESEKRADEVITHEVVFPQDTNHYGTLFGGQMLSWMDKVAYYAATRFCGHNTVTVSVESIDFAVPVRNGDLLDLHGRVIHTARTSMVIRVDVYKAEMQHTSERVLSHTGYFTFVALDNEGKPRRVPTLLLENEEDERLFEVGNRIKEQALARRRSAHR